MSLFFHLLLTCLMYSQVSLEAMALHEIERVSTLTHTLGEGPHWDVDTQSLYYVDIQGGTIQRYDYNENHTYVASIAGEKSISFIIPVEASTQEFAVGLGRRLAVITWNGKSSEAIISRIVGEVDQESELKDNRFNDAKADPSGRFFGGTIRAEECNEIANPTKARFYRYTNVERFVKLRDNVGNSNGLTWNNDTNKFFYIDSCDRDVKEFDYNPDTGNISNERQVINFVKDGIIPEFVPDGMTIDDQGYLYVALWNGARILKINPVNGKIELEINMPCDQITSSAFGGPNLDILFVTSASVTREQPHPPSAGSVFKVTGLKSTGRKMSKVRL